MTEGEDKPDRKKILASGGVVRESYLSGAKEKKDDKKKKEN